MPDENAAVQTPSVDVAAIQAEIAKLDPGQLADALTKVRVRQKVQQKKQYAKGTMKNYQLKARERFKQMKEIALKSPATLVNPETQRPYANLWEQINAGAEAQAEAKIAEAAEVPEEEGTEEPAA